MAQTDRETLVVKNENYDDHCPFRSSFAVTSGVYYYEVIPLTDGGMRFGWATREARVNGCENIGHDEHSIALELGHECYIYHKNDDYTNKNKGKYRITPVPSHASSTVIGCFIDTCNGQFQFYLNGQQVQSPDNVHFSTWPYYATVSLGKGQQCQLNFGQAPFKFAPVDIRFSDFDEESLDEGRYQLTKTVAYKGCYLPFFWFAHPVIDNHVDLFYCDPKQIKCDELVRQLEHIENSQTIRLDHSVECGRLLQSVIEVLDRRLTSNQTDLVGRWVSGAIERLEWNKLFSNFKKAKLLELLCPYLQLSFTSTNSIKFHNICLIVIMFYSKHSFIQNILSEYVDIFLSQTIKTFLNSRLFIADPWTLIYTLYCLKHHHLPHTIQALLNDPFLMSTLNWCSEIFGHVSSVSQLYEPSYDLVRMQAGLCSKWFLYHVMPSREKHFPWQSTLNPQDKGEHIQLSSDCLSARNDYHDDYGYSLQQSVRSVGSVSSDVYYYEAVLITDGEMSIGWATKQSVLNRNKIGWDEYSIGLDGSNGHEIIHKIFNFYDTSLISNFTSKPRWSVGDVVGCLIDCDKKIFRFYLNGKLVKCKDKIKEKDGAEISVHFSAEPYHAAVCLQRHQQCYLNMGQCPFRHPPSFPIRTFHNISPTIPQTLFYSPRLSECYSLVQVLTKDRVELVFDDDKQMQIDQLANDFLENVLDNTNLQINLKTSIDRLRLFQSFVSVSEPMLFNSCLSVYANRVAHLITQSTSHNPAFPDLVAQLLYPYFTLHMTSDTVITHRNVCIVLSSLITVMNHDLKVRVNLYQQVLTYCTEIVVNCDQVTDEWILIFTLVCLGNLDLSENDKQTIRSNKKLYKELQSRCCYNYTLAESHYQTSEFILRQTDFLCQSFLNHLLGTDQKPVISTNRATLNPLDKSLRLKLSPDLLSPRSDWQWQSVRSTSSCKFSNIYFEVTLITSGPMRIGWTNKYKDTEDSKVGDNNNSIAFDGYTRCIWHDGKSYVLKNLARWKAGDIVGCLIDGFKQKFVFYHNQQLIQCPRKTNFSSKAHYAAVSLSSHQQCLFNFGQSPFCIPPKHPTYIDFNYLKNIPSTSGNSAQSSSSINLTSAQIGNAILNVAYNGDNNLSKFKIE